MIQPKILIILCTITYAWASFIVLPDCKDTCGGIDISYPFGIGPNCFLEGFEVTCDENKPYLHGYPLRSINMSEAEVRIDNSFTWQCKDNGTNKASTFSPPGVVDLSSTPFRFSYNLTKLIVVGCQMLGKVNISQDNHTPHQAGCLSYCDSGNRISDHEYQPCGGIGCCQSDIPSNIRFSEVYFDENYIFFPDYNPCRYIALMESTTFNYTKDYVTIDGVLKGKTVPLVLDWTIGNNTCKMSSSHSDQYACKSDLSYCMDDPKIGGYTCHCYEGFEGNPYLTGRCTDIDECARNDTCPHMKCQNTFGAHVCYCPWGMSYNGKRCSAFGVGIVFVSGVGACVALLLLAYFVFIFIKMYKKGQLEVKMQNNFTRHKDILSQKHPDLAGTMRTFTVEELEKATNKFDRTLIVGTGGHGEVYKGILSDKDKQVVAIKKPTEKKPLNNNNNREIEDLLIKKKEIEEFLNEAVISSQLNHRNIVKFIGCCLESEAPWLVYEFISNGTLAEHLHVQQGQSLSWYDRLRIALETAGVLAYLHSAASVSVFHRDIKTGNILLNDGFITKLSDFGASRSVPVSTDEADPTAIQGTFGYLDPEYYETGRLTAKSDVYSFGVILAELLTRKKHIFVGGGSLVLYFRETMRADRLREILDPQIVDEEEITDLESIAALAEMCLRPKGDERPTMKDVQMRLEMIWSSKIRSAHCWNAHQMEQQQPLIESHGSEDRSRVYSSEVELISSASIPR